MGLLVDDEDTALMWRGLILAKALEQFLTDVKWGDLDYLLIDMPPGTGDIQMALSRLLPQAEMLVVTTPARGAQKVAARVADMARRSYMKVLGVVENMSEFVAPDGSRHAIFGEGGGRRLAKLSGAPLVGLVPIETAVSEGGDHGRPVVLEAPDTASASAFTAIADRIVTELLPPVEMAGCTARIFDLAKKLGVTREQRTVFGEVAELYERTRPGYPDGLFDAVLEFGDLHAGDRALEVGAGTGKATRGFIARGLDVLALEPAPGMADVLRQSYPSVIETTFEDWTVEPGAFALLYAAQSWHWVEDHPAAYARAADALRDGGTIALFWNLPREFDGALGADIQAVYRDLAPTLEPLTTQWPLDETLAEIDASDRFDIATKVTVPWTQPYSRTEYVELMGTHSNHRMLDDATRAQIQAAVGAVIDRHGGAVAVTYDTAVYLARKL